MTSHIINLDENPTDYNNLLSNIILEKKKQKQNQKENNKQYQKEKY